MLQSLDTFQQYDNLFATFGDDSDEEKENNEENESMQIEKNIGIEFFIEFRMFIV